MNVSQIPHVVYNTDRQEFLQTVYHKSKKTYYTWTPTEKLAKRWTDGSTARRMATQINQRFGVVARAVNLYTAECIRRGNEYGRQKEVAAWKML